MGLFDTYSSKKPTDLVVPPVPVAPADADKPGFLKSHFGNPEAGEVYGVGNDYETEAEQTKDEKRTANQAIWFLGAFALFLLVTYLIFGL
jgi:hypothetical protein